MKPEQISQAAAAMGRKGGASTSQAKKAAAWANGKKGGRPKKPVGENTVLTDAGQHGTNIARLDGRPVAPD